MSDSNTKETQNNAPAVAQKKDELAAKTNKVLQTENGTTTIDDNVVAKIAGIAAREVSGVDALGGGVARTMGSIRETFGGSENVSQGVSVDVEEGAAEVEVEIIAEYGVAIHELAEAIRRNIINAVERMTGLTVTSVDVTVHDVKLPKDESSDEEQSSITSGQA